MKGVDQRGLAGRQWNAGEDGKQDIVNAFGLDGYLAAAADDKGGRPAAARGGSTKKRR